jgi:magnesium-transporting ATPase (P-type)
MALYSIIEFVTVLMLYSLNSNLGDMQYLYIDLVVVLVIAVVMERTDAYPHLDKQRPLGSLISFPVLFSIFSQIALQVITLVAAYYYLLGETWFTPLVPVENKGNIVCYENTVLFIICSFLMINVSVAFAAGAPYRRPMYTNRLFLGAVIILVCLTGYITLWPAQFVVHLMQLKVPPPFLFRLALIEIAALSFMVAVFIDVSSHHMYLCYTK